MSYLFAFVLWLVFVAGLCVLIRFMAQREIWFAVIRAGMLALVTTTESDERGDATKGGGDIVDIVNGVRGKVVDKSNPDPREWTLVDGEEPFSLIRFILRRLGAQWIGPFCYLRQNVVRSTRIKELGKTPEPLRSKYFYYSSEHAFSAKQTPTEDVLGLEFDFGTTYDMTKPVRAILEVADFNDFLTTMQTERVIQFAGLHEPEEFLGGADSAKLKSKLVQYVKDAKDEVLKAIGITTKVVSLLAVREDEKTRELLELRGKTKREQDALIQIAEADARKKKAEATGDRDADILHAEGKKALAMVDVVVEAQRVKKVILPIAKDPNAVLVEMAHAYRDNESVTTYAPGKDANLLLGQTPQKVGV